MKENENFRRVFSEFFNQGSGRPAWLKTSSRQTDKQIAAIMATDPAWSEDEFAAACDVTPRTVRAWRHQGAHPRRRSHTPDNSAADGPATSSDRNLAAIAKVFAGHWPPDLGNATKQKVILKRLQDAQRQDQTAERQAREAEQRSEKQAKDRDIQAAPSNIPQPGPFKGRDRDVVDMIAKLAQRHGASVLVYGGPGYGKSTLTYAVAHHPDMLKRCGARRWEVKLETAHNASRMLAGIAKAIGLEEGAPRDAIFRRLQAGPCLLLLDNLETPWGHDGKAVQDLLGHLVAAPEVTLVCSLRGNDRAALTDIQWTGRHPLQPLTPAVAREVFLHYAPSVDDNAPGVAADLDDLLAKLGGIPLAIRLVAQRADGEEGLGSIRADWDKMGPLLAQRSSVNPDDPAHRLDSLTVSLALSWNSPRMGDAGRHLFRLLGSLPAGTLRSDVRELLTDDARAAMEQLARVGLSEPRDGRIDLLPPVRDFARRFYPPAATDADWIGYYLTLARQQSAFEGKEGGAAAVARLGPEIANIEAAIIAAAGSPDGCDAAASIVEGLVLTLRRAGIFPARALQVLATSCSRAVSLPGEASCLWGMAEIARMQSRNEDADRLYRQAQVLYRSTRSLRGEADCLWGLADIARTQSKYQDAGQLYGQAKDLFQRADSLIGEADCLWGLAGIERLQDRNESAPKLYRQAKDLFRCAGYLIGEAACLHGLADIAHVQDRHKDAEELYQDANDLFRRTGSLIGEAQCLSGLADIARAHDRCEKADDLYRNAKDLFRCAGSLIGEAYCLRNLADIARRRGQDKAAREGYAAALSVYQAASDNKNAAICQQCLRDLGEG